jgi:hypothetical protein
MLGFQGGGTLLGELEILLEAKETWVSGIKDIERFNMALRLKCLWHNWDTHDRQWKKLLPVTDQTNRAPCSSTQHVFIYAMVGTLRSGKQGGSRGLHRRTYVLPSFRMLDLRDELCIMSSKRITGSGTSVKIIKSSQLDEFVL